MTPRRAIPPANLDPDLHPSLSTGNVAGLAEYLKVAADTLREAIVTIENDDIDQATRVATVLTEVRTAVAQTLEARQIVTEFAMFHEGYTQSRAAERIGVNYNVTGSWWHNPLSKDELTR